LTELHDHIIFSYGMNGEAPDHGLEFLLAFDGRIHHLNHGYWLKFEIKRIAAGRERPHGLSYSFTLHAPDGARLVGFDNAHRVPATGSRFKSAVPTTDHWHRTENDPGRPYEFADADTLLQDFFREVRRVLKDRGIPETVVAVREERRAR
jgi:hypothetical protein